MHIRSATGQPRPIVRNKPAGVPQTLAEAERLLAAEGITWAQDKKSVGEAMFMTPAERKAFQGFHDKSAARSRSGDYSQPLDLTPAEDAALARKVQLGNKVESHYLYCDYPARTPGSGVRGAIMRLVASVGYGAR
jgi:hypothetical protein